MVPRRRSLGIGGLRAASSHQATTKYGRTNYGRKRTDSKVAMSSALASSRSITGTVLWESKK